MLTKSKKYKNILETRYSNACTIMFNRQIDNLGDGTFINLICNIALLIFFKPFKSPSNNKQL